MGPLRIPIRPVFEGLRGAPKGSYVRCFFCFLVSKIGRLGVPKRLDFEGSRGSLLRVLKVIRVWRWFGGFWAVLWGFGRFFPLPWGPKTPPTRATNLRLEGSF